jgi:hypothetical protein
MGFLVMIVAATLLAYLAGLLSFKIKSRWCTNCGTVKTCPRCAAWAGSAGPQGLPGAGMTVDPGHQARTGGGLCRRTRAKGRRVSTRSR